MPQRGRWPLLRDHLEQILSAADPLVADYNLRWAAWGFQHPGEQAEAAVVFRGKKGGGKGLWRGDDQGDLWATWLAHYPRCSPHWPIQCPPLDLSVRVRR
jgi:hypothetical protein